MKTLKLSYVKVIVKKQVAKLAKLTICPVNSALYNYNGYDNWILRRFIMNEQVILAKLKSQADEIRQRFSVASLSVFGSAARGETTGSSDVDVLVSFDRKATFDIFMDLKFYLEELLNMPVDLVTDKALRSQLRKAIEGELINVA